MEGAAVTGPVNAHRVRLLAPLPLGIRVRVAAVRRADRVGCWLACNVGGRAAEWWWRALGMW